MKPLSMMLIRVATPSRQMVSRPAATPDMKSAPHAPASSAAASAAGTTETPACSTAASCVSS